MRGPSCAPRPLLRGALLAAAALLATQPAHRAVRASSTAATAAAKKDRAATVLQVQDTLHNLLQSIAQQGQRVDDATESAHLLCLSQANLVSEKILFHEKENLRKLGTQEWGGGKWAK